MIGLNDSIEELKTIHAKYGVAGKFNAKCDAWPHELPSSTELDSLYTLSEPSDVKFETGLTPLKLFSISILRNAQVGYRWVNQYGIKLENEAWSKSYVVIMDDNGGGKPIIAVCNEENTPIFASYDAVAPFKIASSLADFLMALAKTIDIIYGEFHIFDVSDDDGVSEDFLARMQERVMPILGKENFERYIDYFYG
ncbi:hypothetical protein [Pseudomonas sp. NPDC089401]|uniref:hypothetical protein n=1 Tax=Pseudomonas sp. NPDC089401 TaxID=3364462 RepID=UPI00382ECB79